MKMLIKSNKGNNCIPPLRNSAAVVAMDIQDGLYICIGDGDGGGGGSGVSLPLVGLAEFFDSLGNAPEAYRRRFANVLIFNGPQYYYCSSQIQLDVIDTCGLYCQYYFKRRHRGMELPDIVKDFSTVDLKGNEDKILRSDC